MSNPLEVAAVPTAIAVLQALKTLAANLGTDPAQIAIKFPGALQVFLGTVELQVPTLASSEFGALQTALAAKLDALIAKLQGHAGDTAAPVVKPPGMA